MIPFFNAWSIKKGLEFSCHLLLLYVCHKKSFSYDSQIQKVLYIFKKRRYDAKVDT